MSSSTERQEQQLPLVDMAVQTDLPSGSDEDYLLLPDEYDIVYDSLDELLDNEIALEINKKGIYTKDEVSKAIAAERWNLMQQQTSTSSCTSFGYENCIIAAHELILRRSKKTSDPSPFAGASSVDAFVEKLAQLDIQEPVYESIEEESTSDTPAPSTASIEYQKLGGSSYSKYEPRPLPEPILEPQQCSMYHAPRLDNYKFVASPGTSTSVPQMEEETEWRVKLRRDGTRYITRRQSRAQYFWQRTTKLVREQQGEAISTTDDDSTHVQLGRYCTREARRRQAEHDRERRLRHQQAMQCRYIQRSRQIVQETEGRSRSRGQPRIVNEGGRRRADGRRTLAHI